MNQRENFFGEVLEKKRLSKLSEEEAVRAVESGIKPTALVPEKIDTNLSRIEFEYPEKTKSGEIRNAKQYVYFQPEQRERADRIRDMVTKMTNDSVYSGIKPNADYHRELGTLLGYSDEEIDEFINTINSQASRG